MTNLLPFQASHASAAFLMDPAPHSHAVQFYDSDVFLVETVARFLDAGLAAGDRMVVIATPEHTKAFLASLDAGAGQRALASGQLQLFDARQTLSKFMIGTMPDPDLFADVVDRAIAKAQDGHPNARVRAYGEMVDLLWRDGNSRAAIRLEELWNDAGKDHGFALLCAYVMGNFYNEGDASRFMEVCRTHSHVIPTEAFTQLDDPHARLREISLLQQRARALETEIEHRKELEDALRDALRDRSRIEEDLRECVAREKEARERAEASDSFKEMFIGILGHDLRNPLNTVLTTVRLMQRRGDLPPDTAGRLQRVIASGVRMERMIQQLLDVARARLADGIPITRVAEQDLVALTGKMVDELQVSHPKCTIELRADGPCVADVDPDRMEQVVSNLVGNALAHGDAEQPVTVTVAMRGTLASIAVHNFGPPIDSSLASALFDPFRPGRRSQTAKDGLGLGLYIAERIVSAHGGKIEVESSSSGGTRFEVLLPRSA
jgi:signal transduction histidine kinase